MPLESEMEQMKFNTRWENINIEITYFPDYFAVYQNTDGHRMTHLEIKSENNQRLPITETGYRSHFTPSTTFEACDTVEEIVVQFVKEWLDHCAQSKEWKQYVERSKQLNLFDAVIS